MLNRRLIIQHQVFSPPSTPKDKPTRRSINPTLPSHKTPPNQGSQENLDGVLPSRSPGPLFLPRALKRVLQVSLVYGQEIVGSFTSPCVATGTRHHRETNGGGYLEGSHRWGGGKGEKIKRNTGEKWNRWAKGRADEEGWTREGSKEDGMKTSIAGACNTAVRTEGSGRAINQAAWKMPDQRRDVSAKTVWNRYSRGSRRAEEKEGWL